MSAGPHPGTVAIWVGLARAHRAVLEQVDAALKTEGLPALDWYDVLIELGRDDAAYGLRQVDLERRLLIAQYNLSRLLERMEAAGLVSRRPHPDDRRCVLVARTAAGADLQARMWPVYARALTVAVEDRLTPADAEALVGLLSRLIPPTTPAGSSD